MMKNKILKNIVTLIAFAPMAAHAIPVVVGGFGTDGATLESMPNENSVEQAAQVYYALDLPVSGDNNLKEIEVEQGIFECIEPKDGIHTMTSGCQFQSVGEIVSEDPTVVKFDPIISESIYNALSVDGIQRAGATTKEVANLKCTKFVSRGPNYSCLLSDVAAMQMEIDDN
ncbi:MAG: hypothetical protein R2827_14505 [Bdellovibrionales bacterium]